MREGIEREAHRERERGAEVCTVGATPREHALTETALALELVERSAVHGAVAKHADAQHPRRGRIDRVAAEPRGHRGAQLLRARAALGSGGEL